MLLNGLSDLKFWLEVDGFSDFLKAGMISIYLDLRVLS